MIQLICTGTGGQGVLTLGQVLAKIAMDAGKNATWIPSYGAAMRGGISDCVMKISDTTVLNPYVKKPDILVVMAPSALVAHTEKLAVSGCVIINSSTIQDVELAAGIPLVKIPADEIAAEKHHAKGMNLAMLGALIAKSNLVSKDQAIISMVSYFEKKRVTDNAANVEIFSAGFDMALKI